MTGAAILDRRITIQRATIERNGLNDPVPTWGDLITVSANRKDASANESYRAAEVDAEITSRFTVRYGSVIATVTPSDRISYAGRLYNITAVREKQRLRWYEIDAVAQASSAQTDTTDDSP